MSDELDEVPTASREQVRKAAERLRAWVEMFSPDEESKPDIDHLSEQELIDEAKRVQKEVRAEKALKRKQ